MSRELTPWAATAKATRTAIKARRDELGIPATATIKVTSDSFAGGASVDVWIGDADSWAWRTATDLDRARNTWLTPGERVLTAQAKATGDAIEAVLREVRTAGYIWGSVTYEGTVIGSLARAGWQPGQD
jgi:hypothetical protein